MNFIHILDHTEIMMTMMRRLAYVYRNGDFVMLENNKKTRKKK